MSGIIGRRESRGSGIPTPTKIKLPSAGGIYESDGSTALLTETGGAATLDNVTLGSSVAGQNLLKMSTITTLTGDTLSGTSLAYVPFWDATTTGAAAIYTPDGGPNNTSTIYFYLFFVGAFNAATGDNNIKHLKYDILGDDITNIVGGGTADHHALAGDYHTGVTSFNHYDRFYLPLKPVTLDGSGNAAITVNFYLRNTVSHGDIYWACNANGTENETHLQVMEVV